MRSDEIVPLVKKTIPTIVGFDPASQSHTIGDEARRIGLHGKTTVFNFKPAFGLGDKEFSSNKKYWYWVPATAEHSETKETFTAKEAAQRFLQTLFKGVEIPTRLIVGEPAIRDQTWKENFRRHIRDVFTSVGLTEPIFFPEPFAVFQYYRHIDGTLPVSDKPEIVLIIDIGGGTFNSCIIRTTAQGLLARGGLMALPLGLQAEAYGGSYVDKELLKRVIGKSQSSGVRWKDDPVKRIEFSESPALLRVEDAKIQLSEIIAKAGDARLTADFSHISVSLAFPKGELHPECEIRQQLTGEDLKSVIRDTWRRHYGHIICDTVIEAQQKLRSAMQLSFEKIDRVLVAGGSSRLPFIKEEIVTVLPIMVERRSIHIGSDIGEAVAYGIACECREQAKREPSLVVDKLSPCILNDLYLAFKRTRRDSFAVPRVRANGSETIDGQLLSAPFETEDLTQSYEIDLPFDVEDRLLYYFSDSPFRDDSSAIPLNVPNDIFSIDKVKKVSRKCHLTLEIKSNGLIKPTFTFRGKGDQLSKRGEEIACPEFFVEGFQIREGKKYIGLDFGNSNSYLVQFASFSKEIQGSQYPEFILSDRIKEQLRGLEIRISGLRADGRLTKSAIHNHARDQMLEVIFHSNKLEGNPLTKGETSSVLSDEMERRLTEKELEAKNLKAAYEWMLDNAEECISGTEAFSRHVNQIIMNGVSRDGGEFRKSPVSLAGMDFTPPMASSVPGFMQQLAEEMRSARQGRSALECAASLHTKFVWIHPFSDGNGRTARLLLNAYLLSQDLPVVVINYADRERYLHCLKESNRGDLSSLVEFMIDCFEQQLEDLTAPAVVEPAPEPAEAAPVSDKVAAAMVPIVTALEEVGIPETDDPLATIMRSKVVEQQKKVEADYEAWKQSVLTIPAELGAVVESFNANEAYARAGFQMRCHVYDLLPIEKYIDIANGRSATKTWFIGLEISGPQSRERVLWFFNNASWTLKQDKQSSRVSLGISRFDGNKYTRLGSEPISLREIGYRQGTLLFVSRENKVTEGSVRKVLQGFLADVIKSYVT
jgi:fido (protein-threonine AMPylation protein)